MILIFLKAISTARRVAKRGHEFPATPRSRQPHVGRRRTWAIRTNCGQRGFWPVTLASMDRRKGIRALRRRRFRILRLHLMSMGRS
jgi:hypothetical protein